jgi:hypothetical protein
LFFNNLGLCHIESSGSQLSLCSLFSTFSLLWTQFRASVDTTWTPRWTPKSANPTTKFSVSDEPAIWCPPPRSQRLHLFESHIARWSPTWWRLKVRHRTTKSTGSGLGLWVSKQIIEKHGGSIRVHSKPGGLHSSNNGTRRGSLFSVLLPAELPVAADTAQ